MAAMSLRRKNFHGSEVSLLEGLAVWAGAVGASAARGNYRDAVALTMIGGLGAADDLVEPWLAEKGRAPMAKGLTGHLGALARGHVTTGAAKALGIPVASIALGAGGPFRGSRAMVLADAAVIAASANMANLLDLRPGRCLKAIFPPAVGLAVLSTSSFQPHEGSDAWTPSSTAAVLAAAALPADLGEVGMLGDTGANVLGALVGTAATRALPVPARLAFLTALVGLTVLSEKVSFSRVIDSTPLLHRIDQLGRRQAPREGTA